MAGVHVTDRLQDENAPGFAPRMLLGKGRQLQQQAPQKDSKMSLMGNHAPLPGSTRRALGNITNKAGPQPSVGKPRRALGDITNSSIKPLLQQDAKPGQAAAAAVPLTQAASAPPSLAEQYAARGVERAAGRTWVQQEAERERAQDAAIGRRVAAFSTLSTSSLWPSLLAAQGYSSDEEDDAPLALERPVALAAAPAPASTSGASAVEDASLLQLLSGGFGGSRESVLQLLPDLEASDPSQLLFRLAEEQELDDG